MNAAIDVLTARQLGLGGSEALAYCGRDPRCSPLQLYLRKIGEAGENPGEDARQMWGKRLEPIVRDWLAEELGQGIYVPPRKVSARFPFMFGHLDGITRSSEEGVEIKTGDKFTAAEFGELESDQVPIRYVLQCMHYMIVAELSRFHLGVLLGGNDARHYVIDYDAELAAMLIERARAFWAHVEARRAPPVTNLHDADKRWPKSEARAVTATPAMILALEELKRLRASEKQACEKADACELTLKMALGEADALTDAQGKVLCSWKSQSRQSLDTKALTAAQPELCAQFQRVSNFRVFRIR